jgi:hypothetical protein
MPRHKLANLIARLIHAYSIVHVNKHGIRAGNPELFSMSPRLVKDRVVARQFRSEIRSAPARRAGREITAVPVDNFGRRE